VSNEATISDLIGRGEDALLEGGFRTGDFAQARALLSSARERAKRDGDRVLEAAAADRLGLALHYQNIARLMKGMELTPADIDAEEMLFREALDFREAGDDRAGVAQSLFGLGLVSQVLRRDWASAMPRFWRALEIVEEIGDVADLYTRSEVHRHVGFYYLVEDVRPDEAVRHLQRSLELREQLGDARVIPSGLVALGEAELVAGHPEQAVELLEQALLMARQAGLLAERINDAEHALQDARAMLATQQRETKPSER
jgi:tetratricopeptide (TPR) repeat protein